MRRKASLWRMKEAREEEAWERMGISEEKHSVSEHTRERASVSSEGSEKVDSVWMSERSCGNQAGKGGVSEAEDVVEMKGASSSSNVCGSSVASTFMDSESSSIMVDFPPICLHTASFSTVVCSVSSSSLSS